MIARCCFAVAGAAAVLLGVAVLLGAAAARASTLPNSQRMVSYSVVDQDLRDMLIGIGAQIGLRAQVSARVHGQVHGRLPPATARKMLDRLASLYGFDWYCDDRTLYVSAYDEAVSKILPLGPVGADELVETLQQLGVSDDRWRVRVARASDVVAVDGPPHYAALVDQTLAALAQDKKAGVTEARVFRGTVANQ